MWDTVVIAISKGNYRKYLIRSLCPYEAFAVGHAHPAGIYAKLRSFKQGKLAAVACLELLIFRGGNYKIAVYIFKSAYL